VISEQLPGTRYLAVDIRREISPLADLCSLFHLFALFRREKFALVHSLTPEGWFADHTGCFSEPRSGPYSHLHRPPGLPEKDLVAACLRPWTN